MGAFIDLSGKKFNRLTVLWPEGTKTTSIVWLCVCKCGGLTHQHGNSLRGGGVQSCGCARVKKTPTERFWEKVNKSGPTPAHKPELGPCWVWTGARTAPNKYGVFGGACKNGLTLAHRFSYDLHFGNLSPNLQICHHCDNPPCVNPSHLFQGTPTDNTQDCIKKGRQGTGGAKLTREQAVEIRRLRNEDKLPLKEIGDMFNVTFSNVSVIALGKSWAG